MRAAKMNKDAGALPVSAITEYLTEKREKVSRHFNGQHPNRGRSTYAQLHKGERADVYGQFDNGRQISQDKVAGRKFWYPRKADNDTLPSR